MNRVVDYACLITVNLALVLCFEFVWACCDQKQGRNEVYFLITDPIFLPKILIRDPKSDENFDP